MIQRAFLTILAALAFMTGSAFGQQVLPINSGAVIANMLSEKRKADAGDSEFQPRTHAARPRS